MRGHLETEIIRNCSPTLAGLKTANLINHRFFSEDQLGSDLRSINEDLNPRGVYAELLLMRKDSALIYVYRKSHLIRDLDRTDVRNFLLSCGYRPGTPKIYLSHLRERLREYECFPHEIGLFLGYPLQDVLGFIHNHGQNCKFCGYWKVYGNEPETRKLFEKFRKCFRIYTRCLQSARSISQLTVVA